jgi:hypothetical protein
MPNIRLLPGTAVSSPITINGRVYTPIPGTTVDAPDFDARVLEANGWFNVIGHGSVGATAARPKPSVIGQRFLDTTAAIPVDWDGTTWRNPVSGASA